MLFSLCPVCHRSATSPTSDSIKCFPSVPVYFPVREGVSPNSGISPLLQLPCPGVQVLSRFLSSSFSLLFSVLLSYPGIFIILSNVQGLLLVYSWCSVRIVASVDVFLMHPWREMNSTSSYSSAILTLPPGSKNIRFWRGAIQPLKFLKITKQILSSVYSATIHISVSISVNKIGKWVQVVCVN